jgi:IS6 family transposase
MSPTLGGLWMAGFSAARGGKLGGCVVVEPPVPSRAVRVCRVRFPPEVITVAVRWYLRYGLSYQRYLYRAVDQYGQVIDVLLSEQRDTAAARRFFIPALAHGPAPVEVTTYKAGPYLRVLDELVTAAEHVTE